MARKLASAVALIAMAVSATALALGLGDIQTRSALNQTFEAEVELLSVDPAELDAIRVRLASPEAFQRAGVDRPFYLSGLKFTPQLNAAGKTVIRVVSDKPIREPFLNFLVEVNWPKGKLVREYTVLLDPPTTLARQTPQVARPQAVTPAPAAPAMAPRAAAPAQAVMPDEYGPVQDSETLWGIARKLRTDGASLAQTLMALYKANPNAFVRGDINRLQKGRILRVPGRDEVFALSRREAQAAYAAEQEASLASRTQPPASAASEPSADAQAGTAGGADETTAGDSATGGAAGETDVAGELRIATPRPEGEGAAGAGDDAATEATTEDLKNALLLARENAETSRQAADNLRGEVGELEQQLADMQRLLSLKDEQLARLQAQGQDADQAIEAVAPATEAVAPEAMVDGAAETLPGAADQAAAPEEGEPMPSTEEGAVPADAAAVEADGAAAPATETEAPAEGEVVAEAPQPADMAGEPEAEQPAPEPEMVEPEPKPGLLERISGDTGLLAGIGAAVVAVLVGLMLLLRRRKQQPQSGPAAAAEAEDDLDESILLEPGEGETFDAGPDDAAPAGNDTSFLSEFSPSEMHSLADDTSEVDPVSEADVYIAYGRYDQAESLLGQALSREPERMALKFKLLEVYYANRNVAAFTACAQELADAGQDGVDTTAWQRVCDMGRELAPDYPLFEASAASASEDSLPDFEPSQPASIEPLSEFGEESILDIPAADARKDRDESDTQTVGETEMDLTLDLDDLSMPHSVSQDDESLEGLESIELELPDLDKDPAKKQVASDVSDDSLIFELDTGLEDSAAEDRSKASDDEALDAESLQAQLEELSDLTDLDDELSQLTADFDGLTAPAQAEKPEPEQPAAEAEIPAPFADQMADEDEVQTKLDLAIAYVEMGDRDGARSILDEVRAEGSEEQKAQAEKLLADMDA